MNRDKLSKLTKDQLINLSLKPQKGAEYTTKPRTVVSVKPVKSLVELAANQLEKINQAAS